MVKPSEVTFETSDDSRIKIPLRKLIDRLSSSHHITRSTKPSSIIESTNNGIVVYDRKRISKNSNRIDELDNKAELEDQNFERMAEQQWIAFAQGISTTVNIFYSRVATKIRDYWAEVPTDERNFETLDQFHLLLSAAQYEPITTEEYDMCEDSNYEVLYSITPKWSKMDSEPFRRWCIERNIYQDDPYFARHALIYTTGMYQQTNVGLFLKGKIFYLLSELWSDICKKVPKGWVDVPLSRIERRRKSQEEEEELIRNDDEESKLERYDFGDDEAGALTGTNESVLDQFAKTTKNGFNLNATQSSVFALAPISKRTVSRYTLAQFLKDNGGWFALLKAATLREMFYSSVIVVTRQTRKKKSDPSPWLEIKEYSNVSVADVEALLPARHVHLPPSDKITFTVSVSLILVFLFLGVLDLFEQQTEDSEAIPVRSRLLMVGMLIFGLVGKLYTLVTTYTRTKTTYAHEIDQWLERRREGKDEAILAKLASSVCAQETKEILLAYFFLWKMGRMSPEELQRRIKRFLQTEFKVENFCFDVVDAITKLQNLKLVRRCSDRSEHGSPESSPSNLESKSSNNFQFQSSKEEFEVIMEPADWIQKNHLGNLSDITLLADLEMAARKERARLKQIASEQIASPMNVGTDKKRAKK